MIHKDLSSNTHTFLFQNKKEYHAFIIMQEMKKLKLKPIIRTQTFLNSDSTTTKPKHNKGVLQNLFTF
jgi:hypothetical protein